MTNQSLPQNAILVDVAFYDANEEAKLLAYPTGQLMQQLAASPISLPIAEFLTYYLFHKKGRGVSAYDSYSAIGRRLEEGLSQLRDFVHFTGTSICTASGVTEQLTDISEHIGEAVGLSVISRVHGLTDADWGRIPEMRGRNALPSFDFQIASDGKRIIQVENKGSSVVDNRQHDSKTKAHYRNITKKKGKLNSLLPGQDPNPAQLRYGTITAVDSRQAGNVKCWLTDPTPEAVEAMPKEFRLLRRMSFLRDFIGLVSPRSQLATALATRLADLRQLQNPFELDGIPLRRGSNKPMDLETVYGADGRPSFFHNKSQVQDGTNAGGFVTRGLGPEGTLYFIGIREELLVTAVEQNFEQVIEARSSVESVQREVKCVLTQKRAVSLGLGKMIKKQRSEAEGYVTFVLSGDLHCSSSGLVFGTLQDPE